MLFVSNKAGDTGRNVLESIHWWNLIKRKILNIITLIFIRSRYEFLRKQTPWSFLDDKTGNDKPRKLVGRLSKQPTYAVHSVYAYTQEGTHKLQIFIKSRDSYLCKAIFGLCVAFFIFCFPSALIQLDFIIDPIISLYFSCPLHRVYSLFISFSVKNLQPYHSSPRRVPVSSMGVSRQSSCELSAGASYSYYHMNCSERVIYATEQ